MLPCLHHHLTKTERGDTAKFRAKFGIFEDDDVTLLTRSILSF